MQSFSASAWKAANNESIGEPLRYAAQRLSELLDPRAHYAASASFTLDPLTAVREVVRLAAAHTATGGHSPSMSVMTETVHDVRNVLQEEGNLSSWYPQARSDALSGLSLCTDFSAAKRARIAKREWLRQKLPTAARGPLVTLRNILEDPTSGYRARLLRHVFEKCDSGLPIAPDWRAFDADLRNLTALLLAEGRDGLRIAKSVTDTLGNAGSTASAIHDLKAALATPADRHIVAFCLPGVTEPRNIAAFGCWEPGRPKRWQTQTPRPRADGKLQYWARGKSCVLLTEVEAFDFEHAHTVAFEAAERLSDQYGAEHRAYTFSVSPEMVLLRVRDNRTWTAKDQRRTTKSPRALLRGPNTDFEQSFRYAALARSERAPVVRVLHSWIALESLVSDPSAPGSPYWTLRTRLVPSLALHGVRQGIAGSWHSASRAGRWGSSPQRWDELERWLGVRGTSRNLPDLNAWVDLLRGSGGQQIPQILAPGAPTSDAVALFNELIEDFPPFPKRTIEYWRWMLKRSPRLANWCASMEIRAAATVTRMYVIRNFTVHTALTQTEGASQLAHAAHNVVDTVYEVLPPWLRPSAATWKAFDRLSRRSSHITREWGRHRLAAKIDAENLTRPVRDGLTR